MPSVSNTINSVAMAICCRTVPLMADGHPLQSEALQSATLRDTMIQQLTIFTSEVTRIAREFGADGKLGGQPPGA